MRFILVLFLMSSLSVFAQMNNEKVENLKTLRRIAFGSCNNQNDHQPLWKDIIAQKPDLWIWGGDAIYVDWGKDPMDKAYEKQNNIPDYAFFKSITPMIGTWDDHDYAHNGADGTYKNKEESQQHFLDFIEVPKDSPRRFQEGIYTVHEFGEGDHKIKIIILDNRYFKGLDPKAPLLGEKQWEWFENELKTSEANLHFIVSGLSVFSPTIPYTEEWWHWPVEVKKMRDLLKKIQNKSAGLSYW